MARGANTGNDGARADHHTIELKPGTNSAQKRYTDANTKGSMLLYAASCTRNHMLMDASPYGETVRVFVPNFPYVHFMSL